MKQKKGIILIALIVIAVVIIFIFIRGKNNAKPNSEVQEDGTIVTTSAKLKEKKVYENFEITNIKVTANENLTAISGDVKNVSNKEVDSQYVGIKAYDDKGEVVATFTAIVAPPGDLKGKIEPEETITFSASVTEKVTNIYDIEFVEPTETEIVVPEEN